MRKRTAFILALLFYASILPWTGRAAYFNYDVNNLVVKTSPWVDVRAHLPASYVTDGSVDYSTQIQTAATAANGTCLLLPKGGWYVGTTGIQFDNTACIIGFGSSYGEDNNSSTIIYGGTGAAITVGQDSATARVYNAFLQNFRIKATGDATTSATAIGLKFLNSHYGVTQNLVVRGFTGGKGIWSGATSGNFGASNSFHSNMLWNNLIGMDFAGVDPLYADFASQVFGGSIIGTDNSLGMGIRVDQHAGGTQIYGPDVETVLTGYKISGDHVGLFGTRSEFIGGNHIEIDNTANHTQIFGPNFYSGTVANWVVDANGDTLYSGSRANIRLLPSYFYMLNNIPITMEDNTAVGRNVLIADPTNILLFGATGGFTANHAVGDWKAATSGNSFTIMGKDKFLIDDISSYDNNAAAVAGGLAVKTIYKTSAGQLMIVY
jgi:hypothetical protein